MAAEVVERKYGRATPENRGRNNTTSDLYYYSHAKASRQPHPTRLFCSGMEMAMDSPMPNGDSAAGSAATSVPAAAPPAPQHARLARLAESLKLEHQFLRVPLEHLKKTMRANHRAAEKEISAVISTVAELSSSSAGAPAGDGEDDGRRRSREEAVHQLTSLVSRLQGLKRKLEEGGRVENLQVQRCRARLDHLDVVTLGNQAEWSNSRLKRVLVDYMLRMSYYDTAVKLADISGIQDLVDIDVFLDAKRVIDALHNREVTPALAWCAENKSRLKKSKTVAPLFNIFVPRVYFIWRFGYRVLDSFSTMDGKVGRLGAESADSESGRPLATRLGGVNNDPPMGLGGIGVSQPKSGGVGPTQPDSSRLHPDSIWCSRFPQGRPDSIRVGRIHGSDSTRVGVGWVRLTQPTRLCHPCSPPM
ncbi:hypothetical protein Taro_042546 [Colocasia esculenta]|uniref:CTLH domain-containing protein n=1 Tax=Colocasia esculenta TaxID=4460 RepID=A0A843WP77_COLES|nr:hypothetical protein [Colocasia esculenta]